jgi:hypothetical protein
MLPAECPEAGEGQWPTLEVLRMGHLANPGVVGPLHLSEGTPLTRMGDGHAIHLSPFPASTGF